MGERTGARMDAILRHSLYALIEYPHTTLFDIEKLLDPTDSAFRNQIVRTTEDEQTRRFFEKTYPEFPKDASLPITNRLSPLLRPRVIRNLLCNPTHSFNFRKAMDSGKIQFPPDLVVKFQAVDIVKVIDLSWSDEAHPKVV